MFTAAARKSAVSLEQAGKKSEFVGGLRVTDAESAAIAEMALVGKMNTDLVGRLNTLGGKAVGLNGKVLIC